MLSINPPSGDASGLPPEGSEAIATDARSPKRAEEFRRRLEALSEQGQIRLLNFLRELAAEAASRDPSTQTREASA